MAQPLLPALAGEPTKWDEALYAFLAEKGRRSGSRRTVEGYARMLLAVLPAARQDAGPGRAG